jgi:hypothetical protein
MEMNIHSAKMAKMVFTNLNLYCVGIKTSVAPVVNVKDPWRGAGGTGPDISVFIILKTEFKNMSLVCASLIASGVGSFIANGPGTVSASFVASGVGIDSASSVANEPGPIERQH